jgi:hypothetical protein
MPRKPIEQLEKENEMLRSIVSEFLGDVRIAYLGMQDASELRHSALAKQWPDLCVTYWRAVKVMSEIA